jgi:uncharacterized protein YfbU (UPF0304 family)
LCKAAIGGNDGVAIEGGWIGMSTTEETLELRIDASLLKQIDTWRQNYPGEPSRAQAILRLIEKALGERSIDLTPGEKLILVMLSDLSAKVEVEGEIDPEFMQAAIQGGHYWAIEWEHPSFTHSHANRHAHGQFVTDVLRMWKMIEDCFSALGPVDKGRVVVEAGLPGPPTFPGWHGDSETDHKSIARFMTNRMNVFPSFKDKAVRDSGTPAIPGYRRMLSRFAEIRGPNRDKALDVDDIIALLQAQREA